MVPSLFFGQPAREEIEYFLYFLRKMTVFRGKEATAPLPTLKMQAPSAPNTGLPLFGFGLPDFCCRIKSDGFGVQGYKDSSGSSIFDIRSSTKFLGRPEKTAAKWGG
jgi:hypothetical protein